MQEQQQLFKQLYEQVTDEQSVFHIRKHTLEDTVEEESPVINELMNCLFGNGKIELVTTSYIKEKEESLDEYEPVNKDVLIAIFAVTQKTEVKIVIGTHDANDTYFEINTDDVLDLIKQNMIAEDDMIEVELEELSLKKITAGDVIAGGILCLLVALKFLYMYTAYVLSFNLLSYTGLFGWVMCFIFFTGFNTVSDIIIRNLL